MEQSITAARPKWLKRRGVSRPAESFDRDEVKDRAIQGVALSVDALSSPALATELGRHRYNLAKSHRRAALLVLLVFLWTAAAQSQSVSAQARPDLFIDSIVVLEPGPAPKEGDATSFLALLKNRGSKATNSSGITIRWFIDDREVAVHQTRSPLLAGKARFLGSGSQRWTATPGEHVLTATVSTAEETNINNNSTVATFSVTRNGVAPPRLFGLNIDPANPRGRPTPAQLHELGVSWVRIEYKDISQGIRSYREWIRGYHDAGIKVLLIVDYASQCCKPAGKTGSDAAWETYRQSFRGKVAQLANEFSSIVDAWQIWNEPDHEPRSDYDPYMPAKHFAFMLHEAVASIRPVSTAPIVSAGLAGQNTVQYLADMIAAGGNLTVDAVGIHPYAKRPNDDSRLDPNWRSMSDFLNEMLATAQGKPLWITEVGLPATDQSFQADFMEATYRLINESHRHSIPTVFWFCWSDGMVPPFGLVTESDAEKTAHGRYKWLAKLPAFLTIHTP